MIVACLGRAGRICGHCGRSVFKGMPCKRRTCPRYSRLWAYDWRIVLLENLIAYGGKATMYTLTPPGADHCRGIGRSAATPKASPAEAREAA